MEDCKVISFSPFSAGQVVVARRDASGIPARLRRQVGEKAALNRCAPKTRTCDPYAEQRHVPLRGQVA